MSFDLEIRSFYKGCNGMGIRTESAADASIEATQFFGGAVAQFGARLDGIEEVVGSNPIGSTKSSPVPVPFTIQLSKNTLWTLISFLHCVIQYWMYNGPYMETY